MSATTPTATTTNTQEESVASKSDGDVTSSTTPSTPHTTAQERVNREWDDMASQWDTLAAGYTESLWKHLPPSLLDGTTSERILLDFGCGTGLLTARLVELAATTVLAVDASPAMVQVARDKLPIVVHSLVLGDPDCPAAREFLDTYAGRVDWIIASSVLNFVPSLETTLPALGRLLKPQEGRLLHTDWPPSSCTTTTDTGMTEERAVEMYAMGGLVPESMRMVEFDMGGGGDQDDEHSEHKVNVFMGIARKP